MQQRTTRGDRPDGRHGDHGQERTGHHVGGPGPWLDTAKLALVYPRQSSAVQVRENVYSLENQLKLADQARRDGFPDDRVLVIDEDLGRSARTIDKRIGMTKALAMVDQGLVGALYAEDQTRLSRDRDTVDHMVIAKRCRMAGVPLYYGGSWRDLSDWGTRVAYKVEAVIGSEMWGLHQEKQYKALQAKARKGQLPGARPRYGYRKIKDVPKKDPKRDTLVIEPREAAIIRSLAHRFEEVGSLNKLVREVEAAGACWPDGQPLTFTRVREVLTRPVYRGIVTWGEVVTEGAHEAIIPPEQGERIDATLARNKATLRRPVDDGAQFVGLVRCATCDRKVTTGGGHGVAAYNCKAPMGNPSNKSHWHVNAAQVDAIVLGHLWARLDGALVASIIATLREREARRAEVIDMRAGTIKALQRRVDGLTRSLSSPDIGDAARRTLLLQLDTAARELEAASKAPEPAGKVAADLAFYQGLAADEDLVASLPALWDDQPLAWRRSWVGRFVEAVEVRRDSRGDYTVTTRFRDGSEMTADLTTTRPITAAELDAARQVWADPARPRNPWQAWTMARMAELGYPQTPARMSRVMRAAGVEGRRNPPRSVIPRSERPGYVPPAPVVGEAEADTVRRLWADARRPVVGWAAWMQAEMAAAGFPRTLNGVRHAMKRAGITSTAQTTTGADGTTMRARGPKRPVTDEELAAVRRLWARKDRPARGWVEWMGDMLAARGFPEREPASVRRVVRLAGVKA